MKKIINTGISINDGTGDSLKIAGEKINHNFDLLYEALGDSSSILFLVGIRNYSPTRNQMRGFVC